MSKWTEYNLDDISTKVTDGSHHSPKQFDGGYPMFSVKDMRDHGFEYKDAKKISEEDYIKLIKSGCQPEVGDVLIAKDGSVMKHVFYVKNPPDYVLLSSIAIIRPDQAKVLPEFLSYAIKNPTVTDEILNNYVGGSGVPRIVLKDFKQIDISAPALVEQKRITSVLLSLDEKIILLNKQTKTLEDTAKTLFKHLFVKTANKDWEWKQLGEYTEVIRGLSYKGAGLSDEDNGIPMHNLNSVYEGGGYKYAGIKFYSGEYRKQHLVSPGDLIITNTEQGHDMLLIGFPAIVPQYFGDIGIFSQHIYKLQLKDDYLTVPFLYYLLMTFDMREQIAGSTNGSTVNMLPKDGIEWARFRVPPKSKIDEFTQLVQPMLDKQETNFESIKNLEALRDTLLPKLMSGEVTISDE